MMAELLQDMKTEFRESPGFSAMVVLAVVIGIGSNASILRGADGDRVSVIASRGQSVEEQANRLRSSRCPASLRPGFTILIGLLDYNVELSVPLTAMHSQLGAASATVRQVLCRSHVEQTA